MTATGEEMKVVYGCEGRAPHRHGQTCMPGKFGVSLGVEEARKCKQDLVPWARNLLRTTKCMSGKFGGEGSRDQNFGLTAEGRLTCVPGKLGKTSSRSFDLGG